MQLIHIDNSQMYHLRERLKNDEENIVLSNQIKTSMVLRYYKYI